MKQLIVYDSFPILQRTKHNFLGY
uniref:Uncharacterized protein n=1 Tax=Lepeophtheirus salmonis TaxID=72036 RepID=A0A0K2UF95_LEPSM